MFQWILQFFTTLPEWYWIVGYALLTYGGLRLWIGELSGRIKMEYRDQGMSVLGGALLNLIPLVCSLVTITGLTDKGKTFIFFEGHSRFVGFQMMAVGVAAFLLRTTGDYLWDRVPRWLARANRWIRAQREAAQLRRNRDPQRILQVCRVLLAQAKKERGRLDNADTLQELAGFDQAGDELVKLLEQLFALVEHIDAWFAAFTSDKDDRRQADDIYPDVPLEKFAAILGTQTVDTTGMRKLRECAQGLIESTVRVFQQLPREVLRERALREASNINGLHEAMAKVMPLPETSSMRGLIADLETGRLHGRLLERLAASAAGTPVASEEPDPQPARSPIRVRAKARA